MKAADVIREIDRLPLNERVKVISYVRELPVGRQGKARYIPRAEVERTANRVFEQHSELFKKLAQ
jgi:hypothetical protein